MQKIGLLAALVGACGLAYVAYPKSDRTTDVMTRIPGLAADTQQPTALEKLKSATRATSWPQEQQTVLPAPRVMDQVKQEIQDRPVPPAAGAAPAGGATVVGGGTPAPVASAPPITATPSAPALRTEPPPRATAVVPPAADGIEKLSARLPVGPVAATATSSAPTESAAVKAVTSTLVLPSATGTPSVSTSVQVPPVAAIPPTAGALPNTDGETPASSGAPVAKETTAKAVGPERRRPAHRGAGAPHYAAPGNVIRVPRYTSVHRRNDGI